MADQTFEETLVKVADLEKKITTLSQLVASKKADTDDDTKKQEASFKQAMDDMDKKDKEHSAMHDDHEKVKDAFKKAADESDPEKKKEAMKKAMEMKDEQDKKAKKADDKPDDKPDKEHDAKIAEIVMKKIPLMQTILEATKVMDASNYGKVEKELTAATLEEVQKQYNTIKPYLAAVGVGSQTSVAQAGMGMIPFQADAALSVTADKLYEASAENIDFSKIKTSDIQGMYN